MNRGTAGRGSRRGRCLVGASALLVALAMVLRWAWSDTDQPSPPVVADSNAAPSAAPTVARTVREPVPSVAVQTPTESCSVTVRIDGAGSRRIETPRFSRVIPHPDGGVTAGQPPSRLVDREPEPVFRYETVEPGSYVIETTVRGNRDRPSGLLQRSFGDPVDDWWRTTSGPFTIDGDTELDISLDLDPQVTVHVIGAPRKVVHNQPMSIPTLSGQLVLPGGGSFTSYEPFPHLSVGGESVRCTTRWLDDDTVAFSGLARAVYNLRLAYGGSHQGQAEFTIAANGAPQTLHVAMVEKRQGEFRAPPRRR